MELMEKVPLKEFGDAELERLVEGSRKLIPETRGSILEGTICYS